MPDVFVAAGSNVSPEINLRKAVEALERIYAPLRISPAYRNKAVGFEGEDFINLVVGFTTTDSLVEVRNKLQSVEALCGRGPDAPKWAPRSMDLDILLYDDVVSAEPGFLLPRPDLVKRPYMLKPMADIAPDVVHPTLHKSMRELWEAFDQDGHEMKEVSF
jgi:2-amino-4-hydroxy-6-hydroxymethyldihydropteridine diphosphokinase